MIGKKAVENAIEDAVDGAVDITDDGVAIDTDDGSMATGDDMEWPAADMGGLPVPKGRVTFVMKDNESGYCSVEVSDFAKDDATAYRDTLLEMGYTEGLQAVDEEGITFNCVGADGSSVMFIYSYTSFVGSISYSAPQGDIPEGDTAEGQTDTDAAADTSNDDGADGDTGDSEEDVDMTDVAPWPADFMEEIPRIEGRIISIDTIESYEVIVELENVLEQDARDYIGILQGCGYDVDAHESANEDHFDYFATDEAGNEIYFSWTDGYSSVDLWKVE